MDGNIYGNISTIFGSIISNPTLLFVLVVFLLALIGTYIILHSHHNGTDIDQIKRERDDERERQEKEETVKIKPAAKSGLGSILGVKDERKQAQEKIMTEAVVIEDFAFNPQILTVPVGTTVIWTNKDEVTHNVRSADFSSENLPAGGSFTNKFSAPGTYEYICSIHPKMKGKIIIE